MMKTFVVGGAVRDMLLGKQPKDYDYVVVGSNEQEMLSLGYKKVGADFPVFLHPETGDEYALARKEKKTGAGYNGFACETESVTIEDDLSRRDFTMNSIAYDPETEMYIDPCGGIADLKRGIIRHTSSAFSDDPLRVLRAARFAARYEFDVAQETIELCKNIVESGALDELTYERIWLEFSKIFDEATPSVAIYFLNSIGIWKSDRVGKYIGAHFHIPYEKQLSNIQKMYFWLNIGEKDLTDIHKMCVPIETYKQCRFYTNLTAFLLSVYPTPNNVVEFFELNKQQIKNSVHRDYLMLCKHGLENQRFSGDLSFVDTFAFNQANKIVECFDAILGIDFSFLAEISDKKSIPSIAKETKISVVNKVLNASV